jgi:hypothetical protein
MFDQRQRRGVVLEFFPLISMLCALLAACSGSLVHGSTSTSAPVLTLRQGHVLAAIGVKHMDANGSGSDRTTLQDRRVAFGLHNLMADSFYDSGKFRLVEEKDVRQRQVIEELVELFWGGSRSEATDLDLNRIATRLEADLLAYGTIAYARSSGQRVQIGPLGRYQQKMRVAVVVCLYEVASQNTFCRQGEGTAQQEGMGVFYEFRNDRLDFEKSAAGRATKQAVTRAVETLVGSIRFTQ